MRPGTQGREGVQPFRLVKYFSLTSLVVILISTLALVGFISHRAKTELLSKSEEYAKLVAANLNHQVFLQFVLPTVLKFGDIQLSNPMQFDRMDKVVRNTIHGFEINRVDIYDMNGQVSYSTDSSLIGEKGLGGRNFKLALDGKSSSRLVSRSSFLWFGLGTRTEERKLKTFFPVRVEKPLSTQYGPILGVFELTQDISSDYKAITRLQNLIAISSVVVMGLLFLVLRFIVKRAEGIIARRSEERRKLEEQLHQAERLASLGQMVAGISHEIRNPLGIVGSTAELLYQKMEEGDPKKELGKIIVEETTRLNTIVTDFLDYARPTTPNFSECRVEEILERNLSFLELELERRSIQVERDFASNGKVVQADGDLLYRAFLNIFVNAVEALQDGGTVHVATRYRSFPDRVLEVAVTDSGPGIPEHMQGKIFDPFFTTRESGTGLGLSIVRSIVESHHGEVYIQSPPRQQQGEDHGETGTAVIIFLPAP